MTHNEIIQHVKEISRRLQEVPAYYGEINAYNDLAVFYNDFLTEEKGKEIVEIKNAFYDLCLIFKSISSYSNQGHWKSVMRTACSWFLYKYKEI